MAVIIVMLLGGLLFTFNTEDISTETCSSPDDDSTGTEVIEPCDSSGEGSQDDDSKTVAVENPLVGNTYNLVIDNDPLEVMFFQNGLLSINELGENDEEVVFNGNYEILDEYLHISIAHEESAETLLLDLTYDDLSLDVVSGEVARYELLSSADMIAEEL